MRLSIRLLRSRVTKCDFENASNVVRFHLTSNASSDTRQTLAAVCREWILDNDVARRHATGQKCTSIFDDRQLASKPVGSSPHIISAALTQCGGYVDFHFDGRSSAVRIACTDVEKYLVGKERLPPYPALAHVGLIHRIPFNGFLDATSKEHAMALVRLATDGLVVVQGCPIDNDEAVLQLARAIDVEMPTLYGTSFKVVTAPTEGPRNNVAYSSVALDLHQDLAYHESMPGLQFLLCQRFHPDCKGGESTFLDLNHAAERFKTAHPAAFKTLCEIPAAFMKDDWDRPNPAQYYYATPHIHVNDYNDVIKCFWAPPFEAPLPFTTRMEEYYEARRLFHNLLSDLVASPYLLEFRLNEGDCVIFHQARMLHGRREFSEPHARARRLHGTYVNVDSFRNATITRATKHHIPLHNIPGFANRSYR